MIKTFEKFTQKLNESFHKVDYIQAHEELMDACVSYILDFVKSQGGEIELYEEDDIKYFAKCEGYSYSDEDTKHFWFKKIKVGTVELHKLSGGGSEERLLLIAGDKGKKYNYNNRESLFFTKHNIPTNMILWFSDMINYLKYDKRSGKWKLNL